MAYATGDINLTAYWKHGKGALIQHPSQLIPVLIAYARGFMDDISLMVNESGAIYAQANMPNNNKPEVEHTDSTTMVLQALSQKQQIQEVSVDLGWPTEPTKMFLYIISFIWNGTRFRYTMEEDQPGQITLEPSCLDTKAPQEPQQITRLDPSNAQCTLGAYITLDGSGGKQLEVLKEKTRHWCKCLSKQGGLSNSERWTSYHAIIHLALMYPLMVHCFSHKDLKPIQTLLD